ncbi:Gti1/Pac2 family-domain-containing protein [Pilobolus umbonatus]|nr:Gti1/Pac2 family-domain-containing protein [Pilobolus umbonatus]
MLVTETFHGYIETTQDVLLIFEGCRRGLLPRICRRLQERERKMIRSGSIFVFDERESGIKRWTDGRIWSPSRILGNFLIYRELDKKVAGEKKQSVTTNPTNSLPGNSRRSFSLDSSVSSDRNKERLLVGSLSDSYVFKEDGLMKKTMSIVVNGVVQHLISYYNPGEVVAERLRAPSSVPELASLEISPELLVKQNFRIPPLVEPTFDQNDTALTGQITPPEPHTNDRRMHPLRSMSVGSIRGHEQDVHNMIRSEQSSQLLYQSPYTQRTFDLDSNRSNHQQALSIPVNVYGQSNTNFTNMPSPASMTSSPSTPMLSPARHSYQHQRHYSTSSASSNSLPRFDPRNYSDVSFHERHQLSSLAQVNNISDSYLPLPPPQPQPMMDHNNNSNTCNQPMNNLQNGNSKNNSNITPQQHNNNIVHSSNMNNNNISNISNINTNNISNMNHMHISHTSTNDNNNNNNNHNNNNNERFPSANIGQLLNPVHPLHNVGVNHTANDSHHDVLLQSMTIPTNNYGYPLNSTSTSLRPYNNYTNPSVTNSLETNGLNDNNRVNIDSKRRPYQTNDIHSTGNNNQITDRMVMMKDQPTEQRRRSGLNDCVNYYSRQSLSNNPNAYHHSMFTGNNSFSHQEHDALNNNGLDSLILK